MSADARPAHVQRALEIIDREYGPCNDTVNHDGREPMWAAEALADAGLLLTPEAQSVLNAAVNWHKWADGEWAEDLAAAVSVYRARPS